MNNKSFFKQIRGLVLAILFFFVGSAHAAVNFLVVNTNPTTTAITLSVSSTCPYTAVHMYGIPDFQGFYTYLAGLGEGYTYGGNPSPPNGQICIAGVPSSVTVNPPFGTFVGMAAQTTLTLGGASATFAGCANTACTQGEPGINNMLLLPDSFVVWNYYDTATAYGHGMGLLTSSPIGLCYTTTYNAYSNWNYVYLTPFNCVGENFYSYQPSVSYAYTVGY